jgi:hypothetical protein
MENKDRIKFFKDRKVIGIDPGKAGGIVVYSLTRNKVIEVTVMPPTPQELLSFLRIYQFNSVCYLEKVGGLPGMGGSAMFNFGQGFGWIEMALLCCKIPTNEVLPQKWQKFLSLGSRGKKSKTEWKNKLKARAQQLFPSVGKITLATSDALLITKYGIENEK